MIGGIVVGGYKVVQDRIKKTIRFAELNRTSTYARGCELQVGLIGGPIRPTVTEIFYLLMGGRPSHQSKKMWGGGN